MLSALVVLALLQAPEQDVVRLKDGSTRAGFIVEESEASLALEVTLKGSKGETLGVGRISIAKSDVENVERASPEAREKARARAAAFESRLKRFAEATGAMETYASKLQGRPALRTVGQHFEIFSTCEASFLKEATYTLDEMFAAYKAHFRPRRGLDRRIPVYLLADRAEYMEFQRERFGGAVDNPAFYHPKDNYIAAYNRVQKELARAVQAEVEQHRKEMEQAKKRLSDFQQQIDELARRRQEARSDEEARRLREEEHALRKEMEVRRKAADEEIGRCQAIIAKNQHVLREQARAMYQTLFHEGFHAFARNFLTEDRELPRWLNEGMATYFEMSVVEAGELLHGAPHVALQKVCRDAYALRQAIPLADLVKAGGDTFLVAHHENPRRSDVAYAQSWALVHYLMTGGAGKETFDAYVTEVVAGRDPGAALVAVLGRPLPAVEESVRRHVCAGAEGPGKWVRGVTAPFTRLAGSAEDFWTLLLPEEWNPGPARGTIRRGASGARIDCASQPPRERLADDVAAAREALARERAATVAEPQALEIGGREAAMFEASWDQGARVIGARVFVVRGWSMTHVFTYSCDQDTLRRFWPEAEAIVRSLRVPVRPSTLARDERRRVDVLLEEGHDLLRRGMAQPAGDAFTRAGAGGAFALVDYARTLVSMSQGRWADAAAAAERAIALDPDNPVLLRTLALAQMQAGKHDAAAATWRRIVDADPRSEEAVLTFANLCWKARMRDAQAVLARGASAMPESMQIALTWGRASVELMAWGDAKRAFEQALRIDPRNAEAANGLMRLPPRDQKR